VDDIAAIGWVKSLLFDKRVSHKRHPSRLWILGPVCQQCEAFESCCWLNDAVNARELQPIDDGFPVRLWLGSPWLLRKIYVQALVAPVASAGGNTCFELTGIVWRRESTTKTNQTISLTIVVHHFGILCALRHGLKDVRHEPLTRGNWSREFKHALSGKEGLMKAFG
jgi:hypothetical protein